MYFCFCIIIEHAALIITSEGILRNTTPKASLFRVSMECAHLNVKIKTVLIKIKDIYSEQALEQRKPQILKKKYA